MKTKPITLIVSLLNRFNRMNARVTSLTLLCALFFVNATNSYCVTLTKSDKKEIELFLKDKYFIFYNSNKFDSVLNTENGEVTVSISKEGWLPARGPIRNYEFNSIRIENLRYKIKEKPDIYFGPGVKVANKRNPFLIVKRPTKVIKINLKHRIHGSFQVVLDPQNNSNKLTLSSIKKALSIYFKSQIKEEEDIYRVNEYDNYLHRIHSGHADNQIHGKFDINNDFEKCKLCFVYTPRISDLILEKSIAYGAYGRFKDYGLLNNTGEEHQRLNKILKNVLERYPINLLGYKYNASVLSRGLGMYAPAYGDIYASLNLLKVLNDDEMLSLYLAAKIAHIELRHGQSAYYDMLNEIKDPELMGKIISSVASRFRYQSLLGGDVSVGDFHTAVMATEIGDVLIAGVFSGIGTSTGFLGKEEEQASILMHAYAKKNKISINKIKQLYRLLRSIQSLYSNGFDMDEAYGFDLHLPSKYRLFQADNYRFYDIHDRFKLFQSSGIFSSGTKEVGEAVMKIAGNVRLENGLIMNFAILEFNTNENMKPKTVSSIKIGKSSLINLTPQSPIDYYDKKTIIFADYDFADVPISQQEFVISDIHGLDIKR